MKPLNLKAMMEHIVSPKSKPNWKMDYCYSCNEHRKMVYQQFKIADRKYEFYVCEFCGCEEQRR